MNVVLCVICGKLVPESDVAEHACCKAQDECGETRDYDGSVDDGRDFSPPYEP